MKTVVVIGAGSSGIIASIKASENNKVILLEKNDKIAKKILLTGNGKCNYFNSYISIDKYNTDNYNVLSQIISKKNINDTLELLNEIGIYPIIKNGLYYPYSNQSISVKEILERTLKSKNVEIKYNYSVFEIKKECDKFIINNEIIANKVILATGSKAYPKTGSTGDGYNFLKNFNHKINTVNPALVPLETTEKYNWDGTRVNSELSLYINDKFVRKENGELQLTEYGISGICVFNISSIVSKNLNQKINIKINFLPDIDVLNLLENRSKRLNTIEEILESIIPYKLMFVILKKSNIDKNTKYSNLDKYEKELLIKNICEFKIDVKGTLSFDRSQVCNGGLSLNEIKSHNLESKLIKNLYICGEILDVDGICGGYNLAFAFITGYLAGKDV